MYWCVKKKKKSPNLVVKTHHLLAAHNSLVAIWAGVIWMDLLLASFRIAPVAVVKWGPGGYWMVRVTSYTSLNLELPVSCTFLYRGSLITKNASSNFFCIMDSNSISLNQLIVNVTALGPAHKS